MISVVLLLQIDDSSYETLQELAERLDVSIPTLIERYFTSLTRRGFRDVLDQLNKLEIAINARSSTDMLSQEESDGHC